MMNTQPSIVVTLISEEPRDYDGVVSQVREQDVFSTFTISTGNAIRILDSPSADKTVSAFDHTEASTKGRICAIFLSFQAQDSPSITLDTCKQLRNSPCLQNLQSTLGLEIIIQPYDLYLRHQTPGLAVFDMDSTLIQQEVIDELARTVGRYDEVAKVTEAAMRGELDFEESLRQRVSKLEGVETTIWETLRRDVITITPGARELIKVLGSRGWMTAVLSGGFTPLAEWLKGELGLNYAFANYLETSADGSQLTGRLVAGSRIVDAKTKSDLLIKIAEECNVPLTHTIAVGDGSNDLLMMHEAGLGIAFNAKPKVQEAAPARLNSRSLVDIAYVLGFSHQEIEVKSSQGGK